MNILEKEIEDIIWESDNDLLEDRGLYINGEKLRQIYLGKYGIADIVTFKISKRKIFYKNNGGVDTIRDLSVDIYELKKDQINIDTFLQAIGYYKAIKNIISSRYDTIFQQIEYNITLIGKSIDLKSNFIFLTDFCPNLRIYTYKIDLVNGVKFNLEFNYSLKDEDLRKIEISKDVERKILLNPNKYLTKQGDTYF